MNEYAIIANGISKSYQTNSAEGESKELKVLSDSSFEIKVGEVVGFLGPNGSGKSTLFKLIAGITKPNTGQIEVWGRVASLLDIGAGFHPELSGYENIFLMAQLQGISKSQCLQSIEQIITFSEIGEFLHVPVKKYSKGMYLRLAFSTMVHLPFDIYLIDEVLSVGDSYFQEKCKNLIRNLAIKKDKTILVISHNYNELKELCTRYMTVHKSKLLSFSELDAYFQFQSNNSTPVHTGQYQLWENGFTNIFPFQDAVLSISEQPVFDFEDLIPLKIIINKLSIPIQFGISIKDEFNQTVFQSYFNEICKISNYLKIEFDLPTHFFNQGRYKIDLLFYSEGKLHCILNDTAGFTLNQIVHPNTLPVRTWGPTKPLVQLKEIQYAD